METDYDRIEDIISECCVGDYHPIYEDIPRDDLLFLLSTFKLPYNENMANKELIKIYKNYMGEE